MGKNSSTSTSERSVHVQHDPPDHLEHFAMLQKERQKASIKKRHGRTSRATTNERKSKKAMTTFDQIAELVVTNVASWTIVAATLQHVSYLPSAEHFIQWVVGLVVAATVITFNIVRTIHYLIEIRKNKKDK